MKPQESGVKIEKSWSQVHTPTPSWIGHEIRLMQEILLTSWYGKYPIFLNRVLATIQTVVVWDFRTINGMLLTKVWGPSW